MPGVGGEQELKKSFWDMASMHSNNANTNPNPNTVLALFLAF
jgi:hypothetical protein